ncbi:MAG: DEAD/DEAH box helicase [Gammaproteobacteria bacterium]|nr:DEAD/DEAH box helicase [Gammaproteobacteria bacterium]MBU0788170.1 DEAD/DEAH box helicase [Gammaproteobacteria bacterium]MBU0815333.1 DEAD/DEAH box helicase [Gammaproteobacteria bacterium]MBU1785559.1 DEAD/DEAH box helicase [Gammaproteobacteria bacterium]
MKIQDLLSRVDRAISDLMPAGALSLVTAIDPELAYPRNLIKVLLQLSPADGLLENPATRIQLLLMLKPKEANELASRLSGHKGEDVYDFLSRVSFKRKIEKTVLFDFFELGVPSEEVREQPPVSIKVIPGFGLFSHQARALRKVELFLNNEPHRALLHMPTGSGKTRTAMNVVANYLREREKGVVVWLAHSEELCEQAADEFTKSWNALGIRDVSLIRYWGAYDADLKNVDDGVVIAGLKKAYSKLRTDDHQIRSLSAKNPLVVMDEAHQAIAPTYQLIINQLMRPQSDARLLGLSATPGRTWNDPEADRELSEFFASQKVSLRIDGFDNPVAYLIERGYLADPKFIEIESSAKLALSPDEQRRIQESFELPESVLDRLAADEKRNLLIVHHAEQLLKRHRRVILFAASVQQSDLLAAVLSARGVWASSITSKSPNGRAESIAAFKDDEDRPKILCNFGVLTTGFDAPQTSAALIARPTLSLVLYSQMVGRAMRGTVAGGNATCEILTVVDTSLPGFKSVVEAFSNWEDVWKESDE